MLVEMLVGMAGVDFSHTPGQQVEMDDQAAKRLIEAGFASPVKQLKVEKAAMRSKTATRTTK